LLTSRSGQAHNSITGLKAKALTQADEFCAAKHMTFTVLNSTNSEPPYIFGNYPRGWGESAKGDTFANSKNPSIMQLQNRDKAPFQRRAMVAAHGMNYDALSGRAHLVWKLKSQVM
jgi:hypothetical protein